MRAIGGYFELELDRGRDLYHGGIALNTARNCFETILAERKVGKVWMPYYTCSVMFEPIVKRNVEVAFYSISPELEPIALPEAGDLNDNEMVLYTNYFGIKDTTVSRLAETYGDRLVVDNSQAFYSKPVPGVPTFYSARKYFGVADGAYLYGIDFDSTNLPYDESYQRMNHLLQRIDCGAESGYSSFRSNDESLIGQPIKRMSRLTSQILSSIDYDSARTRRHKNFSYLHNGLSQINKMKVDLNPEAVPMIYPFVCDNEELRDRLIAEKIFVARYWPNVLSAEEIVPGYIPQAMDKYMAKHLLALPIDQRYDEDDMRRILDVINQTLKTC